jgi:dTDP-glucose 4,6-dehydratase
MFNLFRENYKLIPNAVNCLHGENEWTNIRLVNTLWEQMALKLKKEKDYYKKLITYVKDRPGHDHRYAINCDKIKNNLGLKQSVNFEQGLEQTIDWYLSNLKWIENVKSGAYKNWILNNYEKR